MLLILLLHRTLQAGTELCHTNCVEVVVVVFVVVIVIFVAVVVYHVVVVVVVVVFALDVNCVV